MQVSVLKKTLYFSFKGHNSHKGSQTFKKVGAAAINVRSCHFSSGLQRVYSGLNKSTFSSFRVTVLKAKHAVMASQKLLLNTGAFSASRVGNYIPCRFLEFSSWILCHVLIRHLVFRNANMLANHHVKLQFNPCELCSHLKCRCIEIKSFLLLEIRNAEICQATRNKAERVGFGWEEISAGMLRSILNEVRSVGRKGKA